MTDLKKGKSYVTVVGKAKVNDRTFSLNNTSQSGYVYSRVNLGVETDESNIVYGELMGGYFPNNPVIFAMNKDDNSSFEVNWADRFNENIIDSVADFRIHKVGIERDEEGKVIVRKFLSPYDMAEYLQEHLKDGMEVVVRGSFQFSMYKDDVQRRFQIQSIFLPYQEKEKDEDGKETGNLLPVEYKAKFVQTLLLTEDSFKRITKKDAEAGEVVISAKVAEYVSKQNGKSIKKTLPFTLPIVVKINKENPEQTEKILNAMFKVKKNTVRELTIEGDIIEGYEKEEVSQKDVELSADIKELIAMGLYSEEEALNKMTVRGNKVSKLVFTRPHILKDDETKNIKIDMDDKKYVPSDLVVVIEEEEEKEEEKKEENLFEGMDTGEDDNSWMGALGI